MNNRRVRFVLKGQGQARHLLLVKSTLWGSCKFLLEHFKGNKVAWRHSPLSPLWSIRPAANEALTILCQWVIYEFDSVKPKRPWRKASFWKIDTCPIKIQCCFDLWTRNFSNTTILYKREPFFHYVLYNARNQVNSYAKSVCFVLVTIVSGAFQ